MKGTKGKVTVMGKVERGVVVIEGVGCLDVEVLTGKSKGQVITVKPEHFSAGLLPGEKKSGEEPEGSEE